LDILGLFISKGEAIATQAEFDGVTEWSAAKNLHFGAVAETHLK
jgi:hypothetical protein